jgi:hypothetical protein
MAVFRVAVRSHFYWSVIQRFRAEALMKNNYPLIRRSLIWSIAALFIWVLFLHFFFFPLRDKDQLTQLATWKTTSARYGLGFPWLGKSAQWRYYDCSGGCNLYTTQRISFGPFYYERKLEAGVERYSMDFDGKNDNDIVIQKIFDELYQ